MFLASILCYVVLDCIFKCFKLIPLWLQKDKEKIICHDIHICFNGAWITDLHPVSSQQMRDHLLYFTTLFPSNYFLLHLQANGAIISYHSPDHQITNLYRFPHKQNTYELCSLRTQSFTQDYTPSKNAPKLKSSTRHKTHE